MNGEIRNVAVIMCDEMYGRAVLILTTIIYILEKENTIQASLSRVMQVRNILNCNFKGHVQAQ